MKHLFHAFRPMAWDFMPTIVFATLAAAHAEVRVAAAAALGVGVAQVAFVRAAGRPIAYLQWVGLGLALASGAASFLTRDPRFIMLKPTLIYLVVAAAMMRSGWMLAYMPNVARGYAEPLMVAWGYAWAMLMVLMGLANAVVALWFSPSWPLFIAAAPLGLKLVLATVQYLSIRRIVRPRIIAVRAAQAAGI